MPRILLIFCAVLLAACNRLPSSYAPPEQRKAFAVPSADLNSMLVAMSNPDVAVHIVKDIEPGKVGDNWRWTTQNPTLKILAVAIDNLKLSVDFALWKVAFEQTGPVEISFRVNDRLLDKVRYTSEGQKHFEKLIPSDWLTTDVESTVSASIDKLYTAPDDGKKFGFILSRIGFVP